MIPNMNNVVCYVEVQDPTSADYGLTTATWPPNDKDRAGVLQAITTFYQSKGRLEDAQRFSQAINQTPWTKEDDPK
jgi:hypothetical protein